jgi:DNA-binding NtrC family response regulator
MEHAGTSDPTTSTLVGVAPSVCRLRREISAVAPTRSTVLLTGETGTGKSLAARVVHALSPFASGPLVHVDCAALAPTVIESELFGHERGAFTGAHAERAGRLELAAGGTLFLDEIGELEPRLQTKLLRALEERRFERVGGRETRSLAARIVAATNRDLPRAVERGEFRADLYYRLCVFEIRVPALRERLEDLPALVERGLARAARRLGRAAPCPTPGFLRRLAQHPWPGNVRELLNVLERVAIAWPGLSLSAAELEALLGPRLPAPPPQVALRLPRAVHEPAEPWVPGTRDERARIAAELVATGGNVSRAARRLGLPRTTLRHRIDRYALRGLIPRD